MSDFVIYDQEVIATLLRHIQVDRKALAEEQMASATFIWQCIRHNPTEWQLGWYHEFYNNVYYPQATIIRRSSGQWSVYVHVYGTPGFYINEPSRVFAMQAAEKYLEDIAKNTLKSVVT